MPPLDPPGSFLIFGIIRFIDNILFYFVEEKSTLQQSNTEVQSELEKKLLQDQKLREDAEEEILIREKARLLREKKAFELKHLALQQQAVISYV